jgi:hypothetical protein
LSRNEYYKAFKKIELFYKVNKTRRIGELEARILATKLNWRTEPINVFADYFILMYKCLAWLSDNNSVLDPGLLRLKLLIKIEDSGFSPTHVAIQKNTNNSIMEMVLELRQQQAAIEFRKPIKSSSKSTVCESLFPELERDKMKESGGYVNDKKDEKKTGGNPSRGKYNINNTESDGDKNYDKSKYKNTNKLKQYNKTPYNMNVHCYDCGKENERRGHERCPHPGEWNFAPPKNNSTSV